MTITVAGPSVHAAPAARLTPVWVGLGVYALFLLVGDRLLNDADTLWQVTIGQWIIDHRAVPEVDVYSFTMRGQPWMSTQWLAQLLYAASYRLAGWSGVVIVAAGAIALTFALVCRFVGRRLGDNAALIAAAAALALMAPHLLARPHVVAMPVMVAFVGGLIDASDRRAAPSLWLLPLIALWANLHGGFVLGLMLIAPIGLDAVLRAEAAARPMLALRWGVFAALALIASWLTPYGWNALLASQKILSLGAALALISEWRPADFAHLGALEVCLLLGLGAALVRGVELPPLRVVLLLGLIHMALSHSRSIEVLALLAPLVLAQPLMSQIGAGPVEPTPSRAPWRGAVIVVLLLATLGGSAAYAAWSHPAPQPANSPADAVRALKAHDAARVFNDYDFGGYLVANGVAPFIDGRTELYGESFVVAHDAATKLDPPQKLFDMLDEYQADATLLRSGSPAAMLLDHVDGWRKIFADDIATVHLRDAAAIHTVSPRVTR